jgi:hypothetical protein
MTTNICFAEITVSELRCNISLAEDLGLEGIVSGRCGSPQEFGLSAEKRQPAPETSCGTLPT